MGIWEYQYTDELYHHGIKGQKWGVRRFEDRNGNLTPAGKRRYSVDEAGKRRLSKEEKRSRAKKIGAAVGAGVAGTAAVGAGVYAYKHRNRNGDIKRLMQPALPPPTAIGFPSTKKKHFDFHRAYERGKDFYKQHEWSNVTIQDAAGNTIAKKHIKNIVNAI